MATLEEDIEIIKTAVYGKEMRPAISDALTQSWAAVEDMIKSVDRLNERVDSLPGSGGDDPDTPPSQSDPDAVLVLSRVIDSFLSTTDSVGIATLI